MPGDQFHCEKADEQSGYGSPAEPKYRRQRDPRRRPEETGPAVPKPHSDGNRNAVNDTDTESYAQLSHGDSNGKTATGTKLRREGGRRARHHVIRWGDKQL